VTVRSVVIALALAVIGAGGGYAASALDGDEPRTISMAMPVPAASPSYPSDPETTVLPDPDFPALQRNLRYDRVRVGTEEFPVELRIPRGWIGTKPVDGEWRWYPPPGPDDTKNTYFLRVRTVANQYQAVSAALDQRIHALEVADEVADFATESRSGDTFVATYVTGGYRRVAMERFVTDGRSETASASIGVVGRERDRDGMTSLLESVTGLR